MGLMTSDAKLFGLDLRELTAELHDAFHKLVRMPWLRRAMPFTLVKVAGDAATIAGARAQGMHIEWTDLSSDVLERVTHTAVLLDSEQVLQRSLTLPPMAPAALRSAIELDVQTMTPFAPQDTLWSYVQHPLAKAQGRQRVEVVIASRNQVEQALRLQSARLPGDGHPEVWAPAGAELVVLPGFGEPARLRSEAKRRNWILMGLGIVLALGVALAVTPSLQLRMRAIDASQQLAALTKTSAEVMAQRQALVEGGANLGKLQERLQQQLNHLQVLAVLTKVLPDDSAAQRVVLRGTKLTVQGLTSNASNVVALLAKTPGFLDVRLPTAVTRAPGSGKENFVLEANIDPNVLGLLAKAAEEKPSVEGDADPKEAQ